jgi:hypothetical protein
MQQLSTSHLRNQPSHFLMTYSVVFNPPLTWDSELKIPKPKKHSQLTQYYPQIQSPSMATIYKDPIIKCEELVIELMVIRIPSLVSTTPSSVISTAPSVFPILSSALKIPSSREITTRSRDLRTLWQATRIPSLVIRTPLMVAQTA